MLSERLNSVLGKKKKYCSLKKMYLPKIWAQSKALVTVMGPKPLQPDGFLHVFFKVKIMNI
jgi:hypothetical protein